MVRVRFAPSPTGYLHIGGTRTALFNWLYAKAQQGKFILRIEDTDKKRSQEKYLEEILESLKWLRLDWEEIYFQGKRFEIYHQYAKKLLAEEKAYKSEGAIILKISANPALAGIGETSPSVDINTNKAADGGPPRIVKWEDLIHGLIEFDTVTIKDQVLIKSDETPTYNFACVVDDADMQISHVIRGDDHISNTPKQIVIYQALGLAIPKFAHLPLILGKDGARLSKRTGATAISDYRKMGYLPQAIVNYLMLLGWSPGANQEIIHIDEAIKKFSIRKVNKTAAIFSLEKLNWINNHYIKKSETNKILDLLIPLLKAKKFIKDDFDGSTSCFDSAQHPSKHPELVEGLTINPERSRRIDRNYLLNVVKLFQGRINTLQDFINWADFIFLNKPKFEKGTKEKFLGKDLSREFNLLIERFKGLEPFDVVSVEAVFRDVVTQLNLNASDLVHPVRVSLTGKTIGPGLFETMVILGKEKTIQRLEQAIKFSKKKKA